LKIVQVRFTSNHRGLRATRH